MEEAAGVRAARGREDLAGHRRRRARSAHWELRARPSHQGLAGGHPRRESLREGRQRGLDARLGWEWYQCKVCKKYKCGKDDHGAAFARVRFSGDCYDCQVTIIESLKRGGDAFLVRQVPPACGAA